HHTVNGGQRKKRSRRHGRSETRRSYLIEPDTSQHARRFAKPARQHDTAIGGAPAPIRPQREQDASSTIQLNSSPNRIPAAAAISGTSDVGVMPGCVLISSQTSPSSPGSRSS